MCGGFTGCRDCVECVPTGDAEMKREGPGGGEGVVEGVGEGVGGVAGQGDVGARWEGGGHAAGGEESVAETIGADADEGGGEELWEALRHIHRTAGVVGGGAVEDALVVGVPEGIGPGEGVTEGLVGEDDVLVCPKVGGEHHGEGVEGCSFATVGETFVAHGLVEVGKGVHRFDGGAEFDTSVWCES